MLVCVTVKEEYDHYGHLWYEPVAYDFSTGKQDLSSQGALSDLKNKLVINCNLRCMGEGA